MSIFENKAQSNRENVAQDLEQMALPEIILHQEEAPRSLSILLNASTNEFGSSEHPLAKKVAGYVEEHPFDPELNQAIRDTFDEGVDEESLFILSLTKEYPEREAAAFETLKTHKTKGVDWRIVQDRLFSWIRGLERAPSFSALREAFVEEGERDLRLRRERLSDTQKHFQNLIDFFKPNPSTTRIRKMTFLPTDVLSKRESGRSFVFGEEIVLMSNIENVDNADHEFLHSIINPIVDKLVGSLSDEQQRTIEGLASPRLKRDYGEGYYSLVCEELIRTYNDIVKPGREPETVETFKKKISELTEERFQQLQTESQSLKTRCEAIGIHGLKDLEEHADEYFDRFEQNRLRRIIYSLYKEYAVQGDQRFEDFFLEHFPQRLEA